LAPDARILAFEPHPRTIAVLRERLAGSRVEIFQVALGDAAGETTIYDFADADGSTQASLSRESVALYAQDVVAHPVSVKTIDALMAEQRIERIALLKIDTEGLDHKVLLGAHAAIAARRIGMIQFEFIEANVATRTTMRDFFDALPGYGIARLCLNGEEWPLDYSVKYCEIPVSQNLIARPVR
jgi:FkbM family methyltransferase